MQAFLTFLGSAGSYSSVLAVFPFWSYIWYELHFCAVSNVSHIAGILDSVWLHIMIHIHIYRDSCCLTTFYDPYVHVSIWFQLGCLSWSYWCTLCALFCLALGFMSYTYARLDSVPYLSHVYELCFTWSNFTIHIKPSFVWPCILILINILIILLPL